MVVLRLFVIVIGIGFGRLHLGQDAVHVQGCLVLLDLDPPLLQKGVQALGVQAALLRQRAHFVRVDGTIAGAFAQHFF